MRSRSELRELGSSQFGSRTELWERQVPCLHQKQSWSDPVPWTSLGRGDVVGCQQAGWVPQRLYPSPDHGCCCLLCPTLRGTGDPQSEHCFSGENQIPEKSQGKQGESCCTMRPQRACARACTGTHTRPALAPACAQADDAVQVCTHGCTLRALRMERELRGRRLCRLWCCHTRALLYGAIKCR